jgi:hypothetical protein
VGARAPMTIPIAGELVVHPDHRSHSLVRRMMGFALEDLGTRGFPLVLNLSGNRYTQLSALRDGWRSAGELEPVRVAPPANWKRSAVAVGRLLLDRTLRTTRYPFGGPPAGGRSTSDPDIVVEKHARPDAMTELLDQVVPHGLIQPLMDRRFWQWRLESPLHTYRILYLEDGLGLRGYAVIGALALPVHRKAAVLDLVAANGDVAARLLQAAMRIGCVRFWSTWVGTMPDASRRVFERAGYRPVWDRDPKGRWRGQQILVRATGSRALEDGWTLEGLDATSIDNWRVPMIASDAA